MFEVLGYNNKQNLLRIISISDPQLGRFKQVGVREKNDRNEINSCGAIAFGSTFG